MSAISARSILWRNARLAPMTSAEGWGLIDEGAIVTMDDTIVWVGAASELPRRRVDHTVDLGGMLVTPGLVDAHTHLVYGGQRADEHALRLQGATYAEVAQRGGGILSTLRATREASEEALFAAAQRRALRLLRQGVTTVEVKSGYGLDLATERRCLRVARRLAETLPLTVTTTYLAAHTLPPEYRGQEHAYLQEVLRWLDVLHQEGLVDAVDAFCERIAFSLEGCSSVLQRARARGLPVKLHAEQLSDSGGAAMAARLGALSCDHLEYLSDEGVTAMAEAGSVAVLLPGAYYMLRETRRPPTGALRQAGVPMAVATDHNPGTSPTFSLLLMAHMACVHFGLTALEALRGITVHAAQALGCGPGSAAPSLPRRGVLAAGMRADFACWEVDHPEELVYWFGDAPIGALVVGGSTQVL